MPNYRISYGCLQTQPFVLQTVELYEPPDAEEDLRLGVICAALRQCTALTSLKLYGIDASDDDALRGLAKLPLKMLVVEQCRLPEVDSPPLPRETHLCRPAALYRRQGPYSTKCLFGVCAAAVSYLPTVSSMYTRDTCEM